MVDDTLRPSPDGSRPADVLVLRELWDHPEEKHVRLFTFHVHFPPILPINSHISRPMNLYTRGIVQSIYAKRILRLPTYALAK